MADLREQGVRLLSDEPRPGAGGSKMAFIHPKSSNGVLYELYDKSESGSNHLWICSIKSMSYMIGNVKLN